MNLLWVVLLLGGFSAAEDPAAEEGEYNYLNGILILDEDNFNEVVTENDFVLINLFTEGCPHCLEFEPVYLEIAAKVESSLSGVVVVAQVDADENTKLVEDLGVQGFPALLLFTKGSPIPFMAPRTVNAVFTWLTKRVGHPLQKLTTAQEVLEFVGQAKVSMVGFFNEATAAEKELFAQESLIWDWMPFGLVDSDVELGHQFGAEMGNVLLWRDWSSEAPYIHYEEELTNADDFHRWINVESLPFVSKYTPDTADELFRNDILIQFVTFVDESDEDTFTALESELLEAAKMERGEVLFVTIDVEHGEDLMHFFDIQSSDIPCGFLVEMEGAPIRYRFPKKYMVSDGIRDFIRQYRTGSLVPTLRSDPEPENNDGPVATVVGNTFAQFVLDQERDVLVLFHAPDCPECKELLELMEKAGKLLKHVRHMSFARMDVSTNEVIGMGVERVPQVVFFGSNLGNATPIPYTGEPQLKSLVEFLHSYTTVPFQAPKFKPKRSSTRKARRSSTTVSTDEL